MEEECRSLLKDLKDSYEHFEAGYNSITKRYELDSGISYGFYKRICTILGENEEVFYWKDKIK